MDGAVATESNTRRREENALLEAAGHGDQAAFAELYDRLCDPLCSLLYALTRDGALARRLLEQTMRSAWVHAPEFHPERGRALCWLVSIARREAVAALHHSPRKPLGTSEFELRVEPAGGATDPVSEGEKESRRVRRAIQGLEAGELTLLESVFLQCRTMAEIPRTEGESPKDLAMRIRGALSALRVKLGAGEPLSGIPGEDQAALYALDLLEEPARGAFVKMLEADAELCRLARELREAQSEMAWAVPPAVPPPELRERLLKKLSHQGGENTGLARRVRKLPRGALVAVGSLVVVILVLVLLSFAPRSTDDGDDTPVEITAPPPLPSPRPPIATPPPQDDGPVEVTAELAPQMPDYMDASARLVWEPESGRVRLAATAMPRLPDGLAYQLWILDTTIDRPYSLGVFPHTRTGPVVTAFTIPEQAGRRLIFFISIEPEVGSARPSGPVVLLSAETRG